MWKAKCLSKCIKLFFSRKKKMKKMCALERLPYLKFSDLLPETHLFFYLIGLIFQDTKFLTFYLLFL